MWERERRSRRKSTHAEWKCFVWCLTLFGFVANLLFFSAVFLFIVTREPWKVNRRCANVSVLSFYTSPLAHDVFEPVKGFKWFVIIFGWISCFIILKLFLQLLNFINFRCFLRIDNIRFRLLVLPLEMVIILFLFVWCIFYDATTQLNYPAPTNLIATTKKRLTSVWQTYFTRCSANMSTGWT